MGKLNREEIAREAYSRATSGNSLTNYAAVIEGFTARGIPASEIKPRENCLTYNAWRAVGRYVRKGEHGVKVTTWIDKTNTYRDRDGKEITEEYKQPWTATVFHISQTDAMKIEPIKRAIRQLEEREAR